MLLAPCALLAACAGPEEPSLESATTPEQIEPQPSPSAEPTTDAPSDASEPGWPTYGRQVLETVEADVEWVSRLVAGSAEYQANRFGEGVAAVWDTQDPYTVEITSTPEGADSAVTWVYTVTTEDKYAGLVAFESPEVAYLAESPPMELIALDGPGSRLVRLDLLTQDAQEVPPPDGTTWSPWGAHIEGDSSGIYAIARSEAQADCVVWIDGLDTEVIACLEGQQVTAMAVFPEGFSVRTFPWGGNVADCRQNWHLPPDGGDLVSIGPADACNVFDGVVLEGWQIWSELDPEVPERLYQAGMLADGPDGEQLSFGLMRTGSLTVCGGYAYWQTQAPPSAWSAYETLRWRPGMDHVERVYEDTVADVYTGPPRCVGETVNITEVSSLADPPTEEFLTLPAESR